MGLRPSEKKDETGGNSALSNGQNNSEPPRDFDGNMRSGDGPPPPTTTPRREAWTARGQLLLNFHDAISRAINSPRMARKCSRIAEDLSKPPSSGANRSAAEDYGAEAALIVEGKRRRDAEARDRSLALGLFSFVALRGGRGLGSWTKRMVANNGVGRSYQFESHLRPSATAPLIKSNNAMDHRSTELKQPSKLTKILRLAVDATVSTAIAALSGAFLFVPRPSAYIEDMAKLPLVKGKSVYAEMVCPPLLDEYRGVLERYGGRWPVKGASDPDGEGVTQEDVSLNVIRTFVENCSKRSAYERALIEERNALSLESDQSTTSVSSLIKRATRNDNAEEFGSTRSKNKSSEEGNRLGTVSIPSPGVPENIMVNLDRVVYSIGTEGSGEHGKK